MNYGAIKNLDIANGPGIRVSLFVSGCRNHCKGCFQPETWDFKYGKEFDDDAFYSLIEMLRSEHIAGLSILGGDPFEPENLVTVTNLCKMVKDIFPNKNIWVWTGYLWEDIKDANIFKYIDVLVDGRFEEKLKDLSLAFRGSSNQRIIDVKKSKECGYAVKAEF